MPVFLSINMSAKLNLSFSVLLLLSIYPPLKSQEREFEIIDSQVDASFRAISAVDEFMIWVSGSNGWFGKSINGGKNWNFSQVKDFEKLDFRSLYAFDANNAIIANAGSPAYILRTSDGGENWMITYFNDDPEIFIDGIDFWDQKHGIIHGDPVKGKMTLIETFDGGYTWLELPPENRPDMFKGEASFAASGTAIRCFGNQSAVVISGGVKSRLFLTSDAAKTWSIKEIPVIQGESGTGAFSVAVKNSDSLVVVGGDYLKESQMVDHVFYTMDGGNTWLKPETPTLGYRECVEYLDENSLIATGPTGTEISHDNGLNWFHFADAAGMHVIRKTRSGLLVVMAGKNGKIVLVR